MSPEIIDLIIRGRKCDDPAVLDAVEEAWEELSERTRAYVASVQDRFPPGLKRIIESYYLHDADVLGIGMSEGQIVFHLRLDTPPQSLLTFRYDLLAPPVINREALPEALRDRSIIKQWDQDEVELVEGEPPTWRQSILLSNGWEITLHFRDVHVEEIPALLPEPLRSTLSAPDDLPQTA